MAVELINIHPVRFNENRHCGIEDGGYRQLVQCGDVTQFQMLISPCLAENNLVTNGSFVDANPTPWNSTGDWTYSSVAGTYTHQVTGGIGTIYQAFNVLDGVAVKVTFTVNIVGIGLVALVAGDYFETFDTSGTYTRYITASNWTELKFIANTGTLASFSDVSVFAINVNFEVQIVDNDGNVVRTLNPTDNPDNFNFNNNYMTVTYDWTDEGEEDCLPNGCYTIEVSDPCDCANGGFVAMDLVTVQNQWYGSGGGWSFNGTGTAIYDGTPSPDDVFANAFLCDGVDYEVTYTLSAMGGGNEFYVRLGSQQGIHRLTDGTFTETVTADTNVLDSFSMVGIDGGGGSFQVSGLSVKRAERTFDYVSNIFKLFDVAPCSVVLRACNDQNSLQGGYNGTGFSPRIRVHGIFGQGGYRQTFKDYENSRGRMSNYYYRGRKIPTLIFWAAEYVHDFVAHLKGYDRVYIDDVEYAIENDDYTPNYGDRDVDYAEGTLDVSLKTSLIEKRRESYQTATCEFDGQGEVILTDGGGVSNDDQLAGENGETLETG